MITQISGTCQYEGCGQDATHIACGRKAHPKAGCFCEEHAEIVSEEGHPGEMVSCPNCECWFGWD